MCVKGEKADLRAQQPQRAHLESVLAGPWGAPLIKALPNSGRSQQLLPPNTIEQGLEWCCGPRRKERGRNRECEHVQRNSYHHQKIGSLLFTPIVGAGERPSKFWAKDADTWPQLTSPQACQLRPCAGCLGTGGGSHFMQQSQQLASGGKADRREGLLPLPPNLSKPCPDPES